MTTGRCVATFLFIYLVGFGMQDDLHADGDDFMKAFGLERKYYLRDCMVKLNFLWDSSVDQSIKWRIIEDMDLPTKKAQMSGDFPIFAGHTTRELKYEMFYFMDQCENRREYVQQMVEEYFLPNIPDFPEYDIEHEGIEPGFDGVTPSCCWLDD